jgi:hypothetical protein
MNLADLSVGANPEGRISITAGTTARGSDASGTSDIRKARVSGPFVR